METEILSSKYKHAKKGGRRVYESRTTACKNMSVNFVKIVSRFIVNDLELALSFYSSLGFQVDHNDESLAIIKADGVDLHIHHDPDSLPSHHVWWIEVKGIDGLYQRCQESSSAKLCSAVKSQP